MKKLLIVFMCVMTGVITFIYSCQNDTKESQPPKDPASAHHALEKTNGLCTCDKDFVNPFCEECVTHEFMQGLKTKTVWVKWTTCSSTDPHWTGCQGSFKDTKITFCYGDTPQMGTSRTCDLYIEVNDPPSCLRCINYSPLCEKVGATCSPAANGKDIDVVLKHSGDINETVTYSYSIVDDPFITISCTRDDPDGHTYTYTCTGSF